MKINRIRFSSAFWVLLSLLALMTVTSCKKSAADLIVGNWKVTEAPTSITNATPVVGDIWEFRSNGALRMQKRGVVQEGSYSVEGSHLYTEGGWGTLGGIIIDMDKNYMKVDFSRYTLGFSRTKETISVNGGGGNDNGGDSGGSDDPVVEDPVPTINVIHGANFITGTVENPQIISFDEDYYDLLNLKLGFHMESNPVTQAALSQLKITCKYQADSEIATFDSIVDLTGLTQYDFIYLVFSEFEDREVFLHCTVNATVTDVNGKMNEAALAFGFDMEDPWLDVPEGAINGLFSVSGSRQVYFSRGNLQYQASTNTWRFAEHQWDVVGSQHLDSGDPGTVSGSDNGAISSTYSGWIDLFGWGTSGYSHGATCYQPWSTSTTNSKYFAYGSPSYNLYDQTGQADWGYNAISNGGKTINTWRTLTCEEWSYVFNTRSTSSGIRFAKAKVNNVCGVILLPDDWSSNYYSLSSTNQSDAGFNANPIMASQWTTLEQHGAVFLPAAGCRYATLVSHVGSFGTYWSSTYDGSNFARDVYFSDSYLDTYYNYYRYFGLSVRLVRVAQ